MQHELLNNLNKPFLRWEFDAVNNWLYLNWIGFVTKENLKKGAEIILNELEEKHYACLLNDNRELCGPWDSSVDYLREFWIPRAHEAGLKYFAHVLSPKVSGALSAQHFHRHTIGTFQMQIFGDMEKAKQWLISMQKNPIVSL